LATAARLEARGAALRPAGGGRTAAHRVERDALAVARVLALLFVEHGDEVSQVARPLRRREVAAVVVRGVLLEVVVAAGLVRGVGSVGIRIATAAAVVRAAEIDHVVRRRDLRRRVALLLGLLRRLLVRLL
jgi:hypothetical protein